MRRLSLIFQISAGDLGTVAADLDRNLSNTFELSSHWKATLLLDEADVFVEQRSTSDIHRNALVCIFLRRLEYYEGILFVTTNRVQTFDDAFASRIHMPLRYDPLNEAARKKVWKGHLDKAVTAHGKAECSAQDLDDLARKVLNGREVRKPHQLRQWDINFVDHQCRVNCSGASILREHRGQDETPHRRNARKQAVPIRLQGSRLFRQSEIVCVR